MKIPKYTIIAACLALAASLHAQSYPAGTVITTNTAGQTVVTLPAGTSLPSLSPGGGTTNTPLGAIETGINWLTSFNPDLTNCFPTATGDVFLGAGFVGGVSIGAEAGGDLTLNALKSTWTKHVAAQDYFRSQAVAGTIDYNALLMMYRIWVGDAMIAPGVGLGTYPQKDRFSPVFTVNFLKMTTKNVAMEVGPSLEMGIKHPLTVSVRTVVNFNGPHS